jgi:DedD protein
METRVKERLIGAVILVALIVALVPEILSGPHKPADDDSGAGPEHSVRTYTVDLEAPDSPAETSSTTAPPPASSSPEQPTAMVENSSESSDLPEFVATMPAPAPATQPATPSRTEPRASATATTGWAVQLGSFSNAENAERLARELRKDGYKAFVSPYQSSGQKRLRVRVGPEQDRARADQLAKRLRRDGHPGTVVEHP